MKLSTPSFTVRFLLFLSPLLPPRREVALQIQPRDLGSSISSPAESARICSHQTRSLGSKYTKNVFASGAQEHFGGCKCRPISVAVGWNLQN